MMAAIDKTEYETHVSLAGGRIRCLRCTAQSSRTKKQCGKPAMNSSTTQKSLIVGDRPMKGTTFKIQTGALARFQATQ